MIDTSRLAPSGWFARVVARASAAVAAAGAVLLLAAAPGQAHSVEVASDPAARSQISAVPPAVTITFNENVIGRGTQVQITGPAGDVTSGATTVTNNIVRQGVSITAPAGEYTVDWHVTSADGHPISGTFTFTASEPAGTAPTPPSPAPDHGAVTTAPTATSSSDGGSISGVTVIGIAAIVLAVLMVMGAGLSAVLKSRRETRSEDKAPEDEAPEQD